MQKTLLGCACATSLRERRMDKSATTLPFRNAPMHLIENRGTVNVRGTCVLQLWRCKITSLALRECFQRFQGDDNVTCHLVCCSGFSCYICAMLGRTNCA